MALLGLFGPGGLLKSEDPQGLLGSRLSPNEAMLGLGLGLLGGGFAGGLPGWQAGMKMGQERRNRTDLETNLPQALNAIYGGQGGGQPGAQPVGMLSQPQAVLAPPGPAAASPAGRNAAAAGRIPGDAGRAVYTGLLGQGFTPIQAAALGGNIQQESNFNPGIVNEREGAYGLIQWREGRRKALEEFARSRGTVPNDTATQLAFIRREMEGSEQGPGRAFLAATDLDTANQALKGYIRYGDDSYGTRLRNAQAMLGGSPVSAPQTGQPATGGGLTQGQAQLLARIIANPNTPEAVTRAMLTKLAGGGGEGFTLSPGQRRYDARGRLVATGGAEDAWRPLVSPEERKLFGIPDEDKTPYQVKSDGQLQAIGRPQTSITMNPGESEFEKKLGAQQAELFGGMASQWTQSQSDLADISQLRQLQGQLPADGFMGAVMRTAGKWGVPVEGRSAIQTFDAIINRLVPSQRPPGSGTMSDRDVELFKLSLPGLMNSPEGNAQILNTMESMARYKAEQAIIAQELMSGAIDRKTAFERLRSMKNPLEWVRNLEPAKGAPAPAPGPGTPVPAPVPAPAPQPQLRKPDEQELRDIREAIGIGRMTRDQAIQFFRNNGVDPSGI